MTDFEEMFGEALEKVYLKSIKGLLEGEFEGIRMGKRNLELNQLYEKIIEESEKHHYIKVTELSSKFLRMVLNNVNTLNGSMRNFAELIQSIVAGLLKENRILKDRVEILEDDNKSINDMYHEINTKYEVAIERLKHATVSKEEIEQDEEDVSEIDEAYRKYAPEWNAQLLEVFKSRKAKKESGKKKLKGKLFSNWIVASIRQTKEYKTLADSIGSEEANNLAMKVYHDTVNQLLATKQLEEGDYDEQK